jgi:hypothetical protein
MTARKILVHVYSSLYYAQGSPHEQREDKDANEQVVSDDKDGVDLRHICYQLLIAARGALPRPS